ncbi:hypothetical protein EDD21DRAFT_361291 [Dissophora ornata]|nr:hypothetical protein EDD21DRAFT_361291 [Dissophora ornata]
MCAFEDVLRPFSLVISVIVASLTILRFTCVCFIGGLLRPYCLVIFVISMIVANYITFYMYMLHRRTVAPSSS